MTAPAFAQTLPTGGQIVMGQAAIETHGQTTTVQQSSSKAIIDWNGFSVAKGATVDFRNGKNGATLNRVKGNEASLINGLMKSEGSVYLINKNGIVVGKTGEINVGGRFVGSTQDMSNESFLAGGDLTLSGASEATIVNYGKIGSVGGDVALVAAKVINEGEIRAANGDVGLLAGYQVLLRDQALSDGKFSVVIGGVGTSVTNAGSIEAVNAELRAQGGNVYALAGNTSGVINATGVSTRDGRIFLTAGEGGEAHISGTLAARKADGAGGTIEVTGTNILLDQGAKLDASGTTGGTVLVGGDWQGGADASLRVADHDLQTANAVVMAPNATIDVSGTEGAGGTAVLWSDAYTNFTGRIDAHGATNGGMVETSSKGNLQAVGQVDASGVAGKAGQWLLDPADITISSAATNNGNFAGSDPFTFTPTSSTSVANVSQINSALSAGTSVRIATGTTSPTGGFGDITLDAGATIAKTGSADATLSLLAYRHIKLNGSITASGAGTGKLNVVLNSRYDDAANGTRVGSVAVAGSINTNGGNLIIGGGVDAAGAAQDAATSGVDITGVINASGGNVAIKGANTGSASNGIRFGSGGSIITSGTGSISIEGSATGSNHAISILSGAGAITAGSGGILLKGTAQTGSAISSASTADITSAGGITLTGNRNVTITNRLVASGASGAINVGTTAGNISLGALSGPGDITVVSPGTLAFGAVTQTGAGNMLFSSGGALSTTATISKTGGDLSTLTLKAATDLSVGGAITASTGGKINVYLNSRANDGASGTITISKSIGTAGGDLVAWGGSALPNLADLAATGSAKSTAIDAHGILVTGTGTTLDAAGGNIGLAGEAHSVKGNSGNAAVRFEAGTVIKTSGTGSIGIKATGNANYGLVSLATMSTTSGAINLLGTSAGAAFAGVGVLLSNGAVVSTGSGNITMQGQATGADTGLMINSNTGAGITSTSGKISLTGTASGANAVEGIAFIGAGVQTISTGGAISMTASGGTTSFNNGVRPKTALLLGVGGTPLTISAGGDLTINASATSAADTAITAQAGGASSQLPSGSFISSGGTLSINAGAPSKGIVMGDMAITAGSNASIESSSGDITFGQFTSNGGTVSVKAAGKLTTGAVNLATTGNTLLQGDGLSLGAITKKGSAAGASNLTIKSTTNIVLDNDITTESGAGKMNVTLNSRSNDGATGSITVNKKIASGGGDINFYGGSAADMSGAAIGSTTGISVSLLAGSTVDANGGNIFMRGGDLNSVASNGIFLGGTVTTNGTGGITGYGNTGSNYTGVYIAGATMAAGDGGIKLVGATSNIGSPANGSGVRIAGSVAANITTTGDLTLTGTSTGYLGIRVDTSAAGTVLKGTNVALNGYSLGGATSTNGILFSNTQDIKITGTNKVTITGTGGATNAGGTSKSAISFGTATSNPAMATIEAGSGGVLIDGTGADSNATFSFDTWMGTADETAPNIKIVSAGAVEMLGNRGVVYRGTITQTGGGASKLSAQAGVVLLNKYTGTNADSLTLSNLSGNIRVLGTIATTKDLKIEAAGVGGSVLVSGSPVATDAALTSGGALIITALEGVTTQALSQTGTTGVVEIRSDTGAVSTGAIDIRTAARTDIKAATTLTTGAITLNGASAVTLDAGAALTPAVITKKAIATGASSLTLKSASDITIGNAITTEANAGKLDVTINARSGGAAIGTVRVNADVITQGGAIAIGGGATGAEGAMGSTNSGILLASGIKLDARRAGTDGGNISLISKATSADAIWLNSTSSILSSGSGSITLDGDASASTGGRGITISGSTIQTGTGAISLTGKSNTWAAIGINNPTDTLISTAGDVTLTGSSPTNTGIWKSNTGLLTVTGRNVTLDGKSTGGANSIQGIFLNHNGAVDITGTNSVTLKGTGGALAGTSSASAITFGSSSYNTAVTINAGSGGLSIDANAESTAAWGFDNYSPSGASAVKYNVAGAINVTSNKGVLMYGKITQTGSAASTITSTGGTVVLGRTGFVDTSFEGALTASGLDVNSGALSVGGALSATATGTAINLGTVTAKSSMMLDAVTSITTGTITQPSNTNTGDLTLKAGTTISTGAINWATGNMTLSAGSDLTPAAITKIAGSLGTSTLTVKSNGNVTVANAIQAAAGAGPLNVTLNSRAADAANGTVTVSTAITTRGGNILLRGGSSALATISDPSASAAAFTAFATEMGKTGTAINLSNAGLLNAGGGDIQLRGTSATAGLSLTAGTLATTGTGAIKLYGYSSSATASGAGSAVNITGANVSTVDGDLTVVGATNQLANSDAVHLENASVTSSKGNVLIAGASRRGAAGTGNLTGVVMKNAIVGVNGAGAAGNLTIIGQGGGGATGGVGVYVAGGSVVSTSSGTTSILGGSGGGSGTTNYGIYLDQNGSASPLVNTTGSGAVTLEGRIGGLDNQTIGGTDIGIYQGPNGSAVIGNGGSGGLTLIANKMALNNGGGSPALLNTTGALVLRPQAGGNFIVDSNILPALIANNSYRANYSSVTFGSTDAASLIFNTTATANTYAATAPLNLASGGTIAIGGTGPLTAAGGLALQAGGAVTQSVAITTNSLRGKAGSLTLTNALNEIAGLGPMAVTSDLSLATRNGLTINGAVTTGTGLVRAGGDLTFAAGSSLAASGAGTALNLTTGTKVINQAGASALSTPGGRWLLWSQAPTSDSLDALAYGFRQYGAVYGATAPALATGNGVLYTDTPSVSVALTGTYSRDYDGTTDAALAQSNFVATGLTGTERATVYSTASFDTKNVGTGKTILADDLAVVVRDGSVKVFGYTLSNFSATGAIGVITPKLLTAGLTGNVSKVYDAGLSAVMQASNYTLTGVIDGETVDLVKPANGLFADKNAGNNKLVTVGGLALSGADASNYTVASSVSGNIGTITPKELTASLTGVVSKTYDGSTVAAVMASNVAFDGVLGLDAVTAASGLTGTYADRNAGTGKIIDAQGLRLTGVDAANYTVSSSVSGAIGTILAKALTLTAVADSKTYDGTTLSGGTVRVTGLVLGDDVSATQSFNSRDAGARTLQVDDVYVISDGFGGANYVVTKGAEVSGTIAKRLVTTTVNAQDKIYDGQTGATGSFSSLANRLLSDDVSLDTSNGHLAFLDRNAGTGKAVVASGYGLTGADAANYTLGAIGAGVANIDKATLTLTAVADSKTYDGNTLSAATVLSSGLISGDMVVATQAFDSKNAGSRNLSVNGWTISDGNGGGNYVVAKVDALGTIGKKTISGQLSGIISKVYDGTTNAVLSGTSLDGVLSGDTVVVSAGLATYADKNAGANKLVTVTGMALGGADGGNYVLAQDHASAHVGTITARQVVAASTGAGAKTYDGSNLLANGQLGTISFVAADADTLAMMASDGVTFDSSGVSGTLVDRNAGTGKVVTLTGYALANNGHGNYVLAGSTAQGMADVARKALVLTAVTDHKVYDGAVTSLGVVQSSGLIAGDTVSATQIFDSKDAGARMLVVDDYAVADGNGGGNYAVTRNAAAGLIDKRAVSTSLIANDKVYDGTTAATGSFGTINNVVSGEALNVVGTLTFDSRNAGANRAVSVSDATLTGADARNYVLDPIADGSASISKANLILTAGVDTKVYDGKTDSAGTVVATGLGAGDSFTATQSFDGKDAGIRTLNVNGGYQVLDGNGGDNYIVTLATNAGTITKRVVTTGVIVDSKVYDGTTDATGSFSVLDNVLTGETVLMDGGILTFADRNAGVGKAVTVTGATLTGADAGNYVLSTVANGTGTITARELTLTAVADTKIYDGGVGSSGFVHIDGLVTGDNVIATQVFDGKTAGDHLLQVKDWTVSDGNRGDNYTVRIGDAVAGTIEKRVINAAVIVNDKVYDGTTAAVGTFAGLTGYVSGDDIGMDSSSGTLAFLDRNAGNGKAVTVTGANLSGADAGNYVLGNVASGTANIAKATLTLTASDDAKVYDGTVLSNGIVGVTGLVNGDLIDGVTQAFDSKAAGNRALKVNGWTITDGNEGGNYTVVKVDAAGTIDRKTISGALAGVVSKVYDGTDAATILPTNLDGVIAGDSVTVTAANASYADKNAGTNKLVTVSGMVLNGMDAANYVLDQDHASAHVGTITARQVTLSTTGHGAKVYDGTTHLGAAQLGTLSFVLADGDATTSALLLADGVTADASMVFGTFDDRNAGTGKGVTLSGYALANNALGNYVLANDTVHGLANIAKATLTLTASGDAKVYDGTVLSNGIVGVTGLVNGDLIDGVTQAFDSKAAGNRALKVNGWTITDGNEGGNYTVVKVDAAGTIDRKTISGALAGVVSKVYDGTDAATILPTNLDGVIAGDSVTVTAANASYADKNAGTNKLVTVSGMVLNGTDAANYVLDQDHASAHVGTITARQVSLSTTGRGTKVYDGTTHLGLAQMGDISFVAAQGDADTWALLQADGVWLDDSGVTGVLADRNAGTGKSAVLSGFALANNGAGNYVLASPAAQAVVDVARKTLTLTASSDSKVYDGSVLSAGSVMVDGLVGGDTLVATQSFDSRNAGNRALKVSSSEISDGNGGNNYLVVKVDAAGTIAKRTVSSAVSANDKVYDGTVTATGTFAEIVNKVSGDQLTVNADLSFADRNAALGKMVTVTNARLEGADAANYQLDPIAVTSNVATIHKAVLTLTASADHKVYNGDNLSSGMVQQSGLVSGDSFTATQIFDSKNAGSRTLQVDGWTVDDGVGGNNYVVVRGAAAAGVIDRRTLTTSVLVDSREYDGTTSATGVFGQLDNLVAGEDVTLQGGILSFANRNAGTGKTVNVSGAMLAGADAANYVLSTVASGTGTITAKNLILNAVSDTKVYDGLTHSNGLVEAVGLVGGDIVNATQKFDGKNAGDRLLQVDGWTVADGNGGNNYVVIVGGSATGRITPKELQVTSQVDNKTYDGTTAATGTMTGLFGIVGHDDVTVQGSGQFTFVDRNAGNGKAVTVSGVSLSGADAGNYVLGSLANGTANIAKAVLTLTASDDARIYDGTALSGGLVGVTGLIQGDTISGVTQAFDSKAAGNRVVKVNGWTLDDGNEGGNYTVVKVDAAGTIGRKLLTGALVGTVGKVYDGTAAATLLGANLDGVIAGDAVTVSTASANYADKNAGTHKLVTVSGMVLNGTDADNYILLHDSASAHVGKIDARTVNVTTFGRGAKTYDGTTMLTAAQLAALELGVADADTAALMFADGVNFDGSVLTGTLADRNAGTGKVVILSGYALSNNALGNYVLAAAPAHGVADVARKALVLTAATDSKVYDGNNASSGTVIQNGLVSGDTVTATQKFDGKDAGNRALVVGNWSIEDGAGGGNYIVSTVDVAGTIAKRTVTTSITANDRIYDGTNVATGTFAPLQNIVDGESLGITGMLTFDDKHVGSGKAVTVSNATLTGMDARNYVLAPIAQGTASIGKAHLVLATVNDIKVYDGLRGSSAAVQAHGLVSGDSFTATQSFDTKNAGARALTINDGWTVDDGNGGNNYVVTLDNNAAGAITQRTLATSVLVDSREYDGTTSATGVFGQLDNLVAGEDVTLQGGILSFANRNAGTGKTVNVSGAMLAGADAANYVLSTVASGTGTITAKNLILNAVSDTKVYDGLTHSNGLVEAVGLVGGDIVNATQKFDGKNAGDRLLQVDGWTVADGNGGNNYVVIVGGSATGRITPKELQVTSQVDNKTYDGTTAATGTMTGLFGIVGHDDVTVQGSGQFTFVDRNAGNGKAVTVSGVSLSGADAGNYVLGSLANGTANIAKAVLTLTASDDARIYDGTALSGGLVGVTGLIQGDTISGVTQAFDSKAAGNRVVKVNGWTLDDGNEGGNYTVVKVDAAGTIGRKLLTGALVGTVGKVYDGTAAATLLGANLDGVIAGDAVTVSTASANYADKNAGTHKLVTVSGMVLNGTDADNYILLHDSASAHVGKIDARTVNVTTFGRGAKTYDGTTMLGSGQLGSLLFLAADGDIDTQDLMAADGVWLDTSHATGMLADRNAGTGKSVLLGGYALGGNEAGNYVLASGTVHGLADVARAQLLLNAVADSKVYDGTSTSLKQVQINGLVQGDSVTASQSFDGKDAGARLLRVGDVMLDDGNDGANYAIVLGTADGTIARRTLVVTLDNATKVEGMVDPALSFTVGGDGLVSGDTLGGTAQREAGESVGNYAINGGSLAAGANYNIEFAPGTFTITAGTNNPDNGGTPGGDNGGTPGGDNGGTPGGDNGGTPGGENGGTPGGDNGGTPGGDNGGTPGGDNGGTPGGDNGGTPGGDNGGTPGGDNGGTPGGDNGGTPGGDNGGTPGGDNGGTPGGDNGGTPGGDNGGTPGGDNGGTPGGDNGGTPGGDNGGTPGGDNGGTPGGDNGGTPGGDNGGTPGGDNGGTPGGDNGGTPGGDNGGTPGGTPGGDNGGTPGGDNGGTPGGDNGGTPGGDNGGTPGGDNGGTPGGDNGGTPGGDNGGTPGGDNGGTPGGDNGGTPGGDNGGTPGTITPEIVKEAEQLGDLATRPLSKTMLQWGTLPAGATGFNPYAASGSGGAAFLPGVVADTVQVTFDGATGTFVVGDTSAEGQASGQEDDLDLVCRVGGRESQDECSAIGGRGLPHSTNRVIAPNLRFTSK
ncbi:YDG domain-containing protein [Sphingobium lignivorans]|uniref:Filamentous hemagglutinin family protein n=1 Tax=Sphingobium lignivorans TaxID=2735886 RepID=A0ABR6NFN4_9SPHN|nr:YDG domain-containing protein [Sphingobium lignivorans]MBB5985447.1 filamentous hemagglutinin family protein [Sphingobium lignivorans]